MLFDKFEGVGSNWFKLAVNKLIKIRLCGGCLVSTNLKRSKLDSIIKYIKDFSSVLVKKDRRIATQQYWSVTYLYNSVIFSIYFDTLGMMVKLVFLIH